MNKKTRRWPTGLKIWIDEAKYLKLGDKHLH